MNKYKVKQFVKYLDNWLWPEQSANLDQQVKAVIAKDNLVVADVGAAGGLDSRWLWLKPYIKSVLFEPDKRNFEATAGQNVIIFPVALAAEPGSKPLYLSSFSDASSLYRLNTDRLNDYANCAAHASAGETKINVDTLDNCLSSQSGLKLDFIKVDAEGADLDVLRGATNSLDTVKGIQIEVSFLERYIGAPFFGEVDAFLRERAFELFILKREHWLRKNQLFGANSNPQIVWADAVYFLTKDRFVKQLTDLSVKARQVEISKFILILLSYGVHDYASDIVAAVRKANLAPADFLQRIEESVTQSVEGFISVFIRASLGVLLGGMFYLLSLPVRPLRNQVRKFLKKRLVFFNRYFYRLTRGGPGNACLHD